MHKRYKKQWMDPKPVGTSRFITGRKKTPARRQRERKRKRGGGSIFQYSPVCSTDPQRYPTSLQRTQKRQTTPMSWTWDRWRGGWRRWRDEGQLQVRGTRDAQWVPNISTDSDDVFPDLAAQMCSKKKKKSKWQERAWVCKNNREEDCLWEAT